MYSKCISYFESLLYQVLKLIIRLIYNKAKNYEPFDHFLVIYKQTTFKTNIKVI